jgi:probable HAF family extracellular repeat protein
MTNIRLQLVRLVSVVLAFAASATLSQAQTNAACTFSFFQVKGTIANPQGNHAFGVNSFATVVGEGETSMNVEKGFVRYSGGGTNFFSNLTFAARNDKGVSVGTYVPSGSSTAAGFMLSGSTLTTIKDPQPNGIDGTHATGINKWNSIVGWYGDPSRAIHGFKRFSNGSYETLDFPGAQATMPAGINDNGTIVGTISDSEGTAHGFIYSNGKWAKVDYPGTVGTTQFLGISNANVIVGLSTSTESGFTFIYTNGQFKMISDSKAAGGVFANGIAANGLIVGDAYMQSSIGSWNGFLASCK